jgi:hypothetical protein
VESRRENLLSEDYEDLRGLYIVPTDDSSEVIDEVDEPTDYPGPIPPDAPRLRKKG